ncbi:putative glycoside hydrolase family 76 protein [Rosellinia necatrix]|uniref:Mannan endo-1,6-alpha-mannosidase n=1 Tax=Rosellinia necatrix TaxID=77044 RepID=A0A1S7ULR2_ROSNE|nr:putative glycoside hydrolase family 76 protein [Rosellinia necatrix]
MVRLPTTLLAACGLLAGKAFGALEVDLDDPVSIKAAAALVAEDLLTFYHGDEPGWVPGILPGPPPDGDYYWWQGGAMWGALLDYRHVMGDKKYDDIISQALLFQVGPNEDYMPPNWTASMGNDDQAFWAYAALLAAETGFTDPPEDQPQWLSLAQAVFNEQTHIDRRVEGGNCDWGLRWQVYRTNNGFDYINTVANSCYFNIGARLARYTGNDTYGALAEKTWDLIERLGYVSDKYDVYDGAHLPDCTEINKAQFSYNAAMLLQGCAFMFNVTNGNETWKGRLDGMADGILRVFFAQDGVAYEPSCEPPPGSCNADMESYRGYLHRWMANSIQLAPHLYETFMPTLKKSAAAGVKQCTGGANGRICGFHWTTGQYDGLTSASLQMNVLGALTALIMPDVAAPLTNNTGGTSKGNPDAGQSKTELPTYAPITTGDKAGASILTILIVTGALSAFAWMSLD